MTEEKKKPPKSEDPDKKEGSWEFKIQKAPEEVTIANMISSAKNRLKGQGAGKKEKAPAPLTIQKVGPRLDRGNLAKAEANRGRLGPEFVSADERVKAACIDLILYLGLWILTDSFKNDVGLWLIEQAKEQRLTHLIENSPDFPSLVRLITFSGLYILGPGLFAAFTSRSVGMAVFGYSVEHVDGGRPNRGPLFLRETFGKLLSALSVLGLFMCFFDKKRRCLHDVLFSTIVVKKNGK